ncbi:MAG: hypothetical protein JWP63_6391 [Candidatus Solibacter sp.]|jgi:hypothetical protein|nr:hypothetical protein [Candidatus Solibacter sp.]
MNIKLGLCLIFASLSVASGSQLSLTTSDVIGFNGQYSGTFTAGSILNHQTGTISEPTQDNSYWLNSDNGPANAYIVIDLGAAYHITSFDLFNTHNGGFGDRGTGNFTIEAGNSVGAGVGPGFDLSGPTVELVNGTLVAAIPANDPLIAQTFTSSDGGFYRYIRFSPHSVASANGACCGSNVYGLNELRVFDGPVDNSIPEPAPMALLAGGLGLLGWLRSRTAR